MTGPRIELAKVIHTGFSGLPYGDYDDEDLEIADAVLRSSWLDEYVREYTR